MVVDEGNYMGEAGSRRGWRTGEATHSTGKFPYGCLSLANFVTVDEVPRIPKRSSTQSQ